MDIYREDGVALIVALMAMMLLTALGVALVLTTSSEMLISANFRGAGESLYAADAAMERAIADLLTVADWDAVLDGSVRSAFVDGPPAGVRTLPDGSSLDLGAVVSMADCLKHIACLDSDMDARTADRPWGPNNPRWQLYAYGRLADLPVLESIHSSFYVVVLVADDPSENDGDPQHDGALADNPGRGVLSVRAEAFGPRGAHKVIETTVARVDTTGFERGYAGQDGGDEGNLRARRMGVATSGRAVDVQTFELRH